jgi:hypothetical protein
VIIAKTQAIALRACAVGRLLVETFVSQGITDRWCVQWSMPTTRVKPIDS